MSGADQVVAAWIAAGVSLLTLVGTLTAQFFGFRAASRDAEKTAEEQRKQLDRTLAEQNQQLDRTLGEQRNRTLNERFVTAAEQLGSDKPAVRLGGVYAMAGLADDWPENRQTCIDVLCAYLRLPYEPDPGPDAPEPQRLAFQASREVRHTVIRVIAAHLQQDGTGSWEGRNFDFTGAAFDGGDFSCVIFSDGLFDFTSAKFTGGTVDFHSATFSGSWVDFSHAEFTGGTVDFSGAHFTGGEIDFISAKFSGGVVNFDSVFAGGWLIFNDAKFTGSDVNFKDAKFTGGEIDFDYVADWSIRPTFPWGDTDTPPSCVRIPAQGTAA